MSRAFVLATCMPPTKGHLNLIRFAAEVAQFTTVIVCTQPGEPAPEWRAGAVRDACKDLSYVTVRHMHRELEQNPTAPGFWDMWKGIMLGFGFERGDFVVSSEPYGQTLADLLDGVFIPYDVDRRLYYTKATNVRDNPATYFSDLMTTFQPHVRQTVTIFGAESTGKTTLSHELSVRENGHWLFEYARPYLELVGAELTTAKMEAIWKGQRALQAHARHMTEKPWVIQDTDLYSTVGYWNMHREFGDLPEALFIDAKMNASDLYIVCPSNIPFETDPLRYGGDRREGTDEYWTAILDVNRLNYKVLTSRSQAGRLYEAIEIMNNHFQAANNWLVYDRMGL